MNKKLIFATLFLASSCVWATVPATVDRTQIEAGQSFTLTINLPSSSDNPDLSILNKNFEVLGTSSSSQTSIINGKISSQNTLSVSLMAKNSGAIVIPPIKVGNDLTNAIKISVAAQAANQTGGKNNSSVYADTNLPKQNIYAGVPFIYTVRLHFNVGLSNVGLEPINIDHAQVQLQGKPTQYRANENGRPYEVAEQKFLITPSKSGQLNIPSIKLKGIINTGNNIIPGIINGQPFAAQTKPQTVQVKAIPNSIPADEWLPAKKITLKEDWSTNDNTVKVGDPITRTISLEALGVPVNTIPELKFITPTGVNAYPDKSQATSNDQGADIVSTKTFKIAYIATKEGTLQFPEIRVKWWDITTDSLKEATIPARKFTVTNTATTSNTASSQAIANHPPTTATKSPNTQGIKNNLWQYLSGLFIALWVITIMVLVKVMRKRGKKQASEPIETQQKVESKTQPTKLVQATPQTMSINSACKQQNVQALNNALCLWAKSHGLSKVYTITDVKRLCNNQALHELIDALAAAQYNNHEFNQFSDVNAIVSNVEKILKHKNEPLLREFYQ